MSEGGSRPRGGPFLPWQAVTGTIYLVTFVPSLFQYAGLAVPVTDQVLGHALFVSALTLLTALAAACAGLLLRILRFFKFGARLEEGILDLNAAVSLAVFTSLVVSYARWAVRGQKSPVPLLYDVFGLSVFKGGLLLGVTLVLLAAGRTRFGKWTRALGDRLRTLGRVFAAAGCLCGLIVVAQLARTVLAPREPQPVGKRSGHPVNIIVIVLDALGIDKTSLGLGQGVTPNLARFAARSTVFSRAYASSNFTTVSVGTILTGKQPTSLGLTGSNSPLSGREQRETLPAVLRDSGYRTAACVGNALAHPALLKAGGFDRVFPMRGRGWYPSLISLSMRLSAFAVPNLWYRPLVYVLNGQWDDPASTAPFPPEANFRDGADFLSQAGSEPRFAYLHVLPPHSPFLADPPFLYSILPERGIFDSRMHFEAPVFFRAYPPEESGIIAPLEMRYMENVLSVDAQLGRFLEWLERNGRFEDSVVVVLSDHGEMFEPRWVGHFGPLLDDVLLQVPLVVHLPGQQTMRVVNEPTSLVDLAPTLLDLAGIPPPSWMDGVSRRGALEGKENVPVPVFSINADALIARKTGRLKGSCRVTLPEAQMTLDIERSTLTLREDDREETFPLGGDAALPAQFEEQAASLTRWCLPPFPRP